MSLLVGANPDRSDFTGESMLRPRTKFRFLKTTGIGGVLFLLPLIVLGALIGQLVPIVWTIADFLSDLIPVPIQTPTGITLLLGASVLVLLLLCFAAGIIARTYLHEYRAHAEVTNITTCRSHEHRRRFLPSTRARGIAAATARSSYIRDIRSQI